MKVTETTVQTTAERAYFLYLERQRLGLPGNEHDDWIQAEKTAGKSVLPVTLIKGIGPRAAAELSAVGVDSIQDLAAWDLSEFGARLPRLTSRARSGRWIEQARALV